MAHQWYITDGQQEFGPYSSEQIKSLADNGTIAPTSAIRKGTDGKSVLASNVAGLFTPLQNPAPATQSQPSIAYPAATVPVAAVPVASFSGTHAAQAFNTTRPVPNGDVVGTPVLACGLVGCGLLIAGVFMPFVQAPFVGSINYFTITKLDTSFVIAAGLISAIAVLLKTTWPLVVAGLTSLGFLTYRFTNFQVGMSRARESLKEDLSDNPFAGLAGAFIEAVGIQWGFAVLVLGSLALIIAPMLREFRKQSDRTTAISSGLVFALAVIVCVGGITYLTFGDDRAAVANSNSSESKPATFSPFSPRKKEPKEEVIPNPVTLGQTIQLGNLKVTPKTAVKRPITVSTGSILSKETKQLDGPFLVITAAVENTSEGQVFNPFAQAKGFDNYGNEFEEYDSTFNSLRDPDTWFGDLKPGEQATVTMVLEPKNTNAKWYRITVIQGVDNQKKFERWSIQLSNE